MAESFTKAKLISEIAATGKLTKADVGRVFDRLVEIAYREATNGFVIPGICKLKVVKKKAARRRNPFTGQTLLIGERNALKIVPLKKAKMAIAPNDTVIVQVLDTPPAAETTAGEPAAPVPADATPALTQASTPATDSATHPAGDEGQIVFSCSECGSMLAAPPTAAGQQGECPFCKAQNMIPGRQPDAVPNKKVGDTSATTSRSISDFILFVCRACGQEIEAPADMVGMNVECPTCGTGLTVPLAEASKTATTNISELASSAAEAPKNRSSMTIRIDLSDLE